MTKDAGRDVNAALKKAAEEYVSSLKRQMSDTLFKTLFVGMVVDGVAIYGEAKLIAGLVKRVGRRARSAVIKFKTLRRISIQSGLTEKENAFETAWLSAISSRLKESLKALATGDFAKARDGVDAAYDLLGERQRLAKRIYHDATKAAGLTDISELFVESAERHYRGRTEAVPDAPAKASTDTNLN